MITFKASFDDGCVLDLKVAEMLEKYGFRDATFYIPARWHDVNRSHGDVPLTQFELLSLARRFKIGSHGITHAMLTRITEAEAFKEITESKSILEGLLGIPVESFCYPRGYANDEIRDVVRKHYKTARNTDVGHYLPSKDPAWISPTVHVAGKRRQSYEGKSWLEEGKRLLDEVVQQDSPEQNFVYHFWGHSWEIERYGAWGEFEEFLRYVSEVRDARD